MKQASLFHCKNEEIIEKFANYWNSSSSILSYTNKGAKCSRGVSKS